MTSPSQPPVAAERPLRLNLAVWTGVVAVVTLALSPIGGQIVRAAAAARIHAPDLALIGRQSPAVQIHLLAALAAVALGWLLIAGRKGRTFHRIAGWTWVLLALAVAISSLFITGLGHGRWSWLHLLTAWTLLVLPLGVRAIRRRDVAAHRRWMRGLFLGGFAINILVAFIPGRLLWAVAFG